jgi:hypothetical protein
MLRECARQPRRVERSSGAQRRHADALFVGAMLMLFTRG